MSHLVPLLRPIVALASLGVLAGVGPGSAPVPAATEHDLPVPAPEREGGSAALSSSAAGLGASAGSGFFAAPFSADEFARVSGGLSSNAFSPTPLGSAEAEEARESGGVAPGWADALGAVAPTFEPAPQTRRGRPDGYYDFYFTRAVYGGGGLGSRGWRRGSWAVDYPKADRQFLVVLGETLDLLRVPSMENAVRLEDPNLRRYPFLYTLEVGGMYLSQPQVEGLRNYLLAGGFLVVDDFWGAWEWRNFEEQMRRVLPGVEFEEIPLDHEIFHVFYDIEEILQVPNIGNARRGVTSECGPCQPHVRGIFDDDGRLMVVVNWNTDLGDAWEWSEQAAYPFKYSNFAYKMAVNFIVYAMTH